MQWKRAIAVGLLFVIAGCGQTPSETIAIQPGAEADDPRLAGGADCGSGLEALSIYQFVSLDDWDRDADVVARFTVVEERAERSTDERALRSEPQHVARALRLVIDEVYRGPVVVGQSFWIRSHQPFILDDGSTKVAVSSDCFQLRVGDTGIGALLGDGRSLEESALLTADSVLLIDGEQVVDTARDDGPFGELEQVSTAELEAAVRREVG